MHQDIRVTVNQYQPITVRVTVGGSGGGGGGTTSHADLTSASRALPDQHPIGAITGLTAVVANANGIQIELALSDVSSLITTGSKGKYTFKFACTITELTHMLGTAPTGQNAIVDIRRTATNTSIFSTAKLNVDAGTKNSRTSATPYVLAVSPLTFSNNEEIEIINDQVGSIVAGKNAVLTLIGTK